MAKIVQLHSDDLAVETFETLGNLIEFALTPDELEAFEHLSWEARGATFLALQRALGKRARIARSTVRRICGLA